MMPKTSNMPKMNRFVALEKSLEAARAALMSPLGFVDGNLPFAKKLLLNRNELDSLAL